MSMQRFVGLYVCKYFCSPVYHGLHMCCMLAQQLGYEIVTSFTGFRIWIQNSFEMLVPWLLSRFRSYKSLEEIKG